MGRIRHLMLFLTSSLVIIPPLISNQVADYSWSQEMVKNMYRENSPIQNAFTRQSHLTIPSNINWIRSTQPAKRRNQIPDFLDPLEKKCDRKIVFPPLPSIDLKIPYLDVLPAQQVLVTYTCCVTIWEATISEMLWQRKCIPQKPVTFVYMILGNTESLTVSPS